MIAHLDCSSGISGDKFLGALIDAGFEEADLRDTLAKVGIAAEEIVVERVTSGGIAAVQVRLSERAEATPQPLRRLSDIRELIANSGLPERVADRALAVFIRLAVAEADVHGVSVDEVHFHEIGALDTLLDVVGVAAGLAVLGIEHLTVTPVAVGEGTVETAHGTLPVPAPATAGLLLGVPVVSGPRRADGEPTGELTTPTGAALVSVFATDYGPMPDMRASAVGYGAGTRDLGFANVARITLGEASEATTTGIGLAGGLALETVTLLETNIDHLTPEQLAFCAEQLLSAGALDVWQTPIVMKKGRAAVTLSVLCPADDLATFAGHIHEETGSLGVRRVACERTVVMREERTADTRYGPVKVKVAHLGGKPLARPEHEEVARIARETGESILRVTADLAVDLAEARFLE